MTTDYSAVAGSAVLGAPGIRVCLVVSEDGLPLGASPATDERRAAAVWARLCSLGRVTRGFVTVDDELWAFNQNDRHGVLLISDPALRPAVALEVADQVLAAVRPVGGLGAETDASEAWGAREGREMKDLRPLGRRLRSALHPEGKAAPSDGSEPTPAPAVVTLEPAESATDVSLDVSVGERAAMAAAIASDDTPEGVPATDSTDAEASGRDAIEGSEDDTAVPTPTTPTPPSTGDVDVVALAREFSGLLFDREDGLR